MGREDVMRCKEFVIMSVNCSGDYLDGTKSYFESYEIKEDQPEHGYSYFCYDIEMAKKFKSKKEAKDLIKMVECELKIQLRRKVDKIKIIPITKKM